jgi:hypothetical protein
MSSRIFAAAQALDTTGSQYVHPINAAAIARFESKYSGFKGRCAGQARALHAPAGGEAAGLVIYKTSPEQTQQNLVAHWETEQKIVTFDKPTRKLKRLKRLKKGVFLAGQLQQTQENGFRPHQAHFVTLTYAKHDDWQANHISEATDRYRAWCKRRGVAARYLWVAELTKIGRVHYHLICWLPQGVKMTFWDKPRRVKNKKTVAFWTHGMSNTQVAKQGVAYLMKYLSKMGELHEFPDGLRLHGGGGLTPESRQIKQWSNLPEWVKRNNGVGDVKRMGSYFVTPSGECLDPMYSVKLIPGGMLLTRLRDYPETPWTTHDGITPDKHHGPFSTYPRATS